MVVTSDTDNDRNQKLNQDLQTLIAQTQGQAGAQRRQTLNSLLKRIQTSGQLGHPQRGQWPPGQYEDFYQEALQRTLLYIATHLEQYNPQKPVMAWVNQVLQWRFKDVLRFQKKHIQVKSLEDLEYRLPTPNPESESELLKQHLETEPIYQKTHIQDRPDASFRVICLMRINGIAFVKIAAELNLTVSTVSQFFYRNWAKFLPTIRQFFMGD